MRCRNITWCNLAVVLAAVLSGVPGTLPAQPSRPGSSFEESMKLGRKPPPEDYSQPMRDSLDRAFPRGRPRPMSAWMEFQSKSFTELVKRGKYDLLVMPIRSEGYTVDRISRSLILAAFTEELGARRVRVPNAAALERAFGEIRRYEVGDAAVFAKEIGVKKVAIVGLGHDRRERLRAWIVIVDPKHSGSAPAPKLLTEFTLTGGEHPSAVARAIAPALLRSLAISRSPAARTKPAASKRNFFASPGEAMAVESNDLGGRAAAFQIFASLAPEWPERSRERLFEQALLAAQELPGTDPNSHFFAARAWYHLEARESALAALGDSKAPEAVAYREFLNGNLPDLLKAVNSVKDELPRFLLEIDLKTLQTAYGHPDARSSTAFLDAFLAKYPQWKILVERRLADLDLTLPASVAVAKRLLDREFALPGESLEEQLAGIRLTGRRVGTASLAKVTLRHVERARREHRAANGCFTSAEFCVAAAYIDLLEAIAISDPIREMRTLVKIQGLPGEARDLARALRPELEGHPAILELEAEAQLALAMKLPGPQRDPAFAELVRLAQSAAVLEQGQSKTSRGALVVLGVPSQYSAPFISAYRFDLPLRYYWFAGEVYGGHPVDPNMFRLRQLAASSMNLDDAAFLLRNEAGKAELRAILAQRFKGNPDRTRLLEVLASSPKERRQLSAAQRRDLPERWSNYVEEGNRLIDEQNDYAGAAAAFGGFPGFSDPSRFEPIELSNRAYAAGSTFFWQGRVDETRRFYEIAAKLNTGSTASLASAQRLAQLDGNYATMLQAARSRGQRYSDPYAWRDVLSWLMVLGLPKLAWNGFGQLHAVYDNPQVWLAADVGLRMRGGDWEDNKRWLLSEPYRSSKSQGTTSAQRLALMLSAIDRAPAPDLVKTMRELAGPPNTAIDGRMVTRKPASGTLFIGYPRSAFRAKKRAPVRDGTLVESEFVYFADAYLELRKGNYRAAVESFDRMADYYAVEGSVLHHFPGFALPYFAWASAKTGDPLGLEAFVRRLRDGRGGDFDRSLALAFFAGLRNEHKTAQKHLLLAFHHRPFTENRPIFTEYQWAEACEWLYLATKNEEYLRLALDWAHRYQQVMPVSAWAYALEARYTTDEQQRLRATGIALYLDSRSERLASVPAGLRERAQQWFAANNPFRAPDAEKDKEVRAVKTRLPISR